MFGGEILASVVAPDQFYTGMIAELYEPLAGGISPSDRFIEFARERPGPSLELCCGTGLPLLDLVEAGLDVEGLDASADMLRLCAERASERGLTVRLHQGLMQNFSVDRSFDSIYIANGSITLLPDDDALTSTLRCIASHLDDGGRLLVDLDGVDAEMLRPFIGRFREAELPDGATGRFAMTSVDLEASGRRLSARLRYEWHHADGTVDIEERDWLRSIWTPEELTQRLTDEGFVEINAVGREHGVTQLTATKSPA